jgi:hypothetical protein
MPSRTRRCRRCHRRLGMMVAAAVWVQPAEHWPVATTAALLSLPVLLTTTTVTRPSKPATGEGMDKSTLAHTQIQIIIVHFLPSTAAATAAAVVTAPHNQSPSGLRLLQRRDKYVPIDRQRRALHSAVAPPASPLLVQLHCVVPHKSLWYAWRVGIEIGITWKQFGCVSAE